MSIATKIHTFVVAVVGTATVGVGYALANKVEKPDIKVPEELKSQATYKDDPTCAKNVPYCVTYDRKVKIRFI